MTTGLEETWGCDEPIVFLGGWCKRYDRRSAWMARPHTVLRHHWDDRGKLRKDHDYLELFYESLLVKLPPAMGRLHGIDRPLRYWRIIVGPWMLTWLAVLFDRWESIRTAVDMEPGATVHAATDKSGQLISIDSSDFIELLNSDAWNYKLYSDILANYFSHRINISPLEVALTANRRRSRRAKPRPSIKRRLANVIDVLASRFTARNKVSFSESYFQPIALIRLNLAIGQFPRFSEKEFESILDPDPVDRAACGFPQIDYQPRSDFECFVMQRFWKDIPYAYCDEFAALVAKASRITATPKIILTANSHWFNEIFKVWAAEKVDQGARLVVAEHGGSFHHAHSGCFYHEERIADAKAVWFDAFHPSHRKLSPNKLIGFRVRSSHKYCSIIAFEQIRYPFRVEFAPRGSQVMDCYAQVVNFYKSLPAEISAKTKVLPHHGFDMGWSTRLRFVDDLGPQSVYDRLSYKKVLSRSRIVVCTYPQTTFSEAMVSGVPALLLYRDDLWQTIPEANRLIEVMKQADIVFTDHAKAARHLERIWAAPDEWWNTAAVRAARDVFCQTAARVSPEWLREWRDFLLGELSFLSKVALENQTDP